MLNLHSIVKQSQSRFQQEVEKAEDAKGVDPARLHRRKNETYFTRLTRACLPVSNNFELSDPCYAICVAVPELLFSKMYFLGWGQARKQAQATNGPPRLLQEYRNSFTETTNINRFYDLLEHLKSQEEIYSLICHGLSPTSDTLLLLADLGRSLRVSYSLGINKTKVLLADISWVKHNRSINQIMSKKEFLNSLRICLDKRKRLYQNLGLEYQVFGINNFGTNEKNISRSSLEEVTREFRELARGLWGEDSLKPHDARMKKLIGTAFDKIKTSERSGLPLTISVLAGYPGAALSLEKSLESQLTILRTISDLFSTFDEEIFIYYFAQFFAQRQFRNYLKIAPCSEDKFDKPFGSQGEHFSAFAGVNTYKQSSGRVQEMISASSDGVAANFQIYLPQYRLGKYEILPYTSVSGDVIKSSIGLENFVESTILLDDSYDEKIDKIIGVIDENPTISTNKIISDLLSFIHILTLNDFVESRLKRIRILIGLLDEQIEEQIFSKEDNPENYPMIYSDWLKVIENENSILPFHIIPYLWEESDWDRNRVRVVAQIVVELLGIVNEMCE